jgi:hypothetical protein
MVLAHSKLIEPSACIGELSVTLGQIEAVGNIVFS